ncbi:hypothetical protein JXL19_01055 [bacterium]|nr:hypothetical protein [bacterium]
MKSIKIIMIPDILKNQRGTAFIITMMLLILLTFMGTFALTTTNIEINIAANEKDYVRDFYICDSGWKEILPWLNNHASPPSLVNVSLNDPNTVKNFGGGGDGMTNSAFPNGTEDGSLSGIPYWNRVVYNTNTFVPGSGSDYLRFFYTVTSNANRRQEIDVTMAKVFKVGY